MLKNAKKRDQIKNVKKRFYIYAVNSYGPVTVRKKLFERSNAKT